MPVDVPTLAGQIPYAVEHAIRNLASFSNALEARVNKIPPPQPPLTLDQIRQALSATGNLPLNLFQLLGGSGGTGAAILYGTHDERVAVTKPTNGQLYFETDRTAIYLWDTLLGDWLLVWGWMDDTLLANRPADLTGNDAGFLFHSSDGDGLVYRWSGNVWHSHIGILRDDFANRPVAFTGCDTGLLFVATDYGDHTWVLDYDAGAWVLLEGWGGPLRDTLANIPGGLTADDEGFLFYATNFDRLYRWSGAAWADAPGQPERGMIVAFGPVAPGTGWALCDGSTVSRSTPTGGTTNVTLPNLTDNGAGHAVIIRGGSVYTGAPFGDGLNGDTGVDDGAGQVVQAGVGVTVAAHTHVHHLLGFNGAAVTSAYMPSMDIPYYCRL